MIESSDSLFINLTADCQDGKAYLNKTIFTPQNIYVSVPIIDKIKIINPSNLPINFKWEEINIADKIKASFYPSKGLIQPRSEKEIKFNIIYNESNYKNNNLSLSKTS